VTNTHPRIDRSTAEAASQLVGADFEYICTASDNCMLFKKLASVRRSVESNVCLDLKLILNLQPIVRCSIDSAKF